MKNNVYIILLSLLVTCCSTPTNTDLIPYPNNMVVEKGHFKLAKEIQIISSDENTLSNEITYLQSLLSSECGIAVSNKSKRIIELNISTDVVGEEAYLLKIKPEKIEISASEPVGIFYGIQTLRQLMLLNNVNAGKGKLPALTISDNPAFVWRGSMIDVSRHFFTIDYLKRHIDRLAFYKLNKFHIHLTDDQGWRIEIKKYPELTEKSAFRTFNKQDSACIKLAKENPDFELDARFITEKEEAMIYGGYYTQEQLRDLIAYAAERHVEIIPEIDMPGHMMAAIAVYPELVDGEIGWGELFSTPICPCKEDVYTFVENVISEVASLFPSQYIHIGADEVDKKTWEKSESCKLLMKQKGFKHVDQLQSYFVHRVQKIAETYGKKIIAWDEALEGGINSDAVIMYWRSWLPDAPHEAVLNNNKVIITPINTFYFSSSQDKHSLRNTYNVDIMYDIPDDKKALIQGAQACLWTERIPSESRADFLLFPRFTALSERLWTNDRSFEDYSNRLLSHYPILDKMKIAYRLPDLCGFAMESVFLQKDDTNVVFSIKNPLKDKMVHYTMDGTVPTRQSSVLNENMPIAINEPVTIKFALFGNGETTAKGDIYTVNYTESSYAEAIENSQNLNDGLTCDFYNQAIDQVAKISGNPNQQFIVKAVEVPQEARIATFGLKYNGYIEVPETGIYSFYLTCDDAGMLYIADRIVIDNEGPHSSVEKSGQVALKKGLHPFRLDFVEGGGGYFLNLQYSMDGCDIKDIPESWLKH